ncbi:MAG TPA: exodeoxyribonuclease V subunit alpha [Euzebya sp.]|nr:exodeoxyribonuclease V subunit alpha [Euzebya sp.]
MTVELDPLRPDRVAAELPDRLRAFNDAGVLSSADVHAAMRLAAVTGCEDPDAVVAAAFAVRAPRYGHVFAQLDQLADTVTDEDGRIVELDPAVWPDDVDAWVAAVAASPLVADGQGGVAPLHLDGARLYLDRYWRYEHRVAAALRDRAAGGGAPAVVVAPEGWAALAQLFDDNAEQLEGATAALSQRLSVIAGGPGTGKTATIASAVAVALNHATRPDGRPLRVSIAAPTGKAAARLGEALRQSAASMPADLLDPGVLAGVVPTTIHRLLGWTPNATRFRRDADNPLPCDLVIVDEVSMVALGMLSRLLDAVPADANLVLVGDPDQLAAVEAGTVLGDLVSGGAVSGGAVSGGAVSGAAEATSGGGWALEGQVVTLQRGYRFDDDIKTFAMAVRDGRAQQALDCLTVDPDVLEDARLSLVVPDRPGEWPTGTGALAGVRRLVTRAAQVMVDHGRRGEATAALQATLATKVLCAHRRGPDGVQVWNAAIEGWVHDVPAYRRPEWYPGRPIMVTDNDYNLNVFNGDIGVVVRDGDQLRVVIDGRSGRPIEHRRLPGVQTVHAMTVHKSQGSQFDRVIVILPSERSPVLTRQLLYTAVTRARTAVTIVGTPDALADAITRPVTRASALPERLRHV